MPVDVVIATPLEPELVDRIRGDVPEAVLHHEPGLLPPMRYACDHRGDPGFRRDPADEERWWELLGRGEVFFGIPGDTPDGLALAVRRCPRLRWVQGTAAGEGEKVRGAGLTSEELSRVTVTSAAGVHATTLTEFVLLGMLAFAKDLPRLRRDQRARRWDHYPMRELRGATVLILGLGGVGAETARLAKALGMYVLGVKRAPEDVPNVDEVYGPAALPELAPRADVFVCTLPGTHETAGLVSGEIIDALPNGCIVVNVGRGANFDEPALIEALTAGRLAGAALDVFATEPLPPDSPLWGLDNVLLSPHTGALSVHENEHIVELFVDNLRRYVRGQPLRNLVDTGSFY
ncbi:MAG: D-2-hydroxyacid dehydrogenase [Streptosporangiales bacterium]|nr:D-2-hydroxyacid dehydrogenase [Streptosporangiales bacterium]